MLAPVQMATAIQADLAEVGIRARIETYEWNSYLARVNAGLEGRGDMAEMAWMTNDPDTLPYLALRSSAVPDQGGFNSGYYSNPEVDRLIDAARVETDRQQRAEIYRELEQQVLRDLPWAIVASWRQNVVAQAQLHGFRLQPSFFLLLDKTYKLADSPAQARSEP
jgi:peptide/nickel transport system substrate-binding protein